MRNSFFSTEILKVVDNFAADTNKLAGSAFELGKHLHGLGFDIDVDFSASTAKKAGREEFYRAAEYYAMAALPANVCEALRNCPRNEKTGRRDSKVMKTMMSGKRAKGVTQNMTLTDWSKTVPRLISGIKGALKLYRDTAGLTPEREVKAKATATEKFFNVIDDYVKRLAEHDASDTFDFDPVVARQHLVALMAAIR